MPPPQYEDQVDLSFIFAPSGMLGFSAGGGIQLSGLLKLFSFPWSQFVPSYCCLFFTGATVNSLCHERAAMIAIESTGGGLGESLPADRSREGVPINPNLLYLVRV